MSDPIEPSKELVDHWVDLLAVRSDREVFTEIAQWGAKVERKLWIDAINKRNAKRGIKVHQ